MRHCFEGATKVSVHCINRYVRVEDVGNVMSRSKQAVSRRTTFTIGNIIVRISYATHSGLGREKINFSSNNDLIDLKFGMVTGRAVGLPMKK